MGIDALQEEGWFQLAREKIREMVVDLVLEWVTLTLGNMGDLELLQAGHLGVLDPIKGQSLLRILQEDPNCVEKWLLDDRLRASKPGHVVLSVPLQAAGLGVSPQASAVVGRPGVKVLSDDTDADPAIDELHFPVVVAPVHEVHTQHLLAVDEPRRALWVGDGAQHPFGPFGAKELDELVSRVTVQVNDEGNCVGQEGEMRTRRETGGNPPNPPHSDLLLHLFSD